MNNEKWKTKEFNNGNQAEVLLYKNVIILPSVKVIL